MSNSISLTIGTSFGDVPLSAVQFNAVRSNADERGAGRPVVFLHGGAGPASVSGFADLLADATGTRVIVPTHPGFGGTPRPDALTTVSGLAEVYAGLLDVLDLEDATVIGNSIGGWITAELAVRGSERLGRIALVDAVGIKVAGHPVASGLTPEQLTQHAWYDPSKAPSVDPASLPAAALEVMAGNRATLAMYGGPMTDATLLGRLAGIAVPALVLWGEADRIGDVEYGRAFAAAIPGARFEVLPRTGHVPQMESPDLLLEALRAFVGA